MASDPQAPEHGEAPDFPPASDLAEFTTEGEKIYIYCVACGRTLDRDVNYLNQAILVWKQHLEEAKAEAD